MRRCRGRHQVLKALKYFVGDWRLADPVVAAEHDRRGAVRPGRGSLSSVLSGGLRASAVEDALAFDGRSGLDHADDQGVFSSTGNRVSQLVVHQRSAQLLDVLLGAARSCRARRESSCSASIPCGCARRWSNQQAANRHCWTASNARDWMVEVPMSGGYPPEQLAKLTRPACPAGTCT